MAGKRIRDSGGTFVDPRYALAGGELIDALPYRRWVAVEVDFQDLIDSGETDGDAVLTLPSVPAGTFVHDVQVDLKTGLEAAVALTQATLIVGDATDPNGLLAVISDLDDAGGTTGFQAVAVSALGAYLYDGTAGDRLPLLGKLYSAETAIQCTVVITGDTINDLNAGRFIIHLDVSSPGKAAVSQL